MKRGHQSYLCPETFVSLPELENEHMRVLSLGIQELQTINGCVRPKQEVGVAQGDRLPGPSLARAVT